MNGEITVFAPAKVILCGEHSVVYGHPALAAAIDRGCTLRIKRETSGKRVVTFSAPQLFPDNLLVEVKHGLESGSGDVADTGVCSAIRLCFARLPVATYSVKADFSAPIRAGVGGSAALSVALAAASQAMLDPRAVDGINFSETAKEIICTLAFECERAFHGNPSGLDNTVSTYGGFQLARNGVFSAVQCEQNLQILLVNTCVPRSTKALVSAVRLLKDKEPAVFSEIMNQLENSSTSIIEAVLGNTDLSTSHIPLQMRKAQELLTKLGVGNSKLSEICDISARCGFGAKLTGAGGGGCAVVDITDGHFLPTFDSGEMIQEERIESLVRQLTFAGFETFRCVLGSGGVQVLL